MKQSINQSTNQSTSQSVNQSINQVIQITPGTTVGEGLSVQYNVRKGEREQIGFQSLAERRQSRSWSHSVQTIDRHINVHWLSVTSMVTTRLTYLHRTDHCQKSRCDTHTHSLRPSWYSPHSGHRCHNICTPHIRWCLQSVTAVRLSK